ncbi:MAG: hypothetical protein DI635_11715 [Pseudoxanthomonas suwonensis]|nr:MAG: hypothetical protein DI635_11715 [Pseudoxanthomonas suwonensis]
MEIARTDGIQLEYQVSMPEDAATPEAMANATFTDPSTMPVGTVVRVDDSQYTNNEFSATFRNIRVCSDITESEGSSMVVEKTGENTVRVTVGPTAGIDAYNGVGVDVGVDVGVASASIGNNTSLDSATFQTSEFGLSTPEGQAAYNHFLATGEMPTQNGNGITNVQTIQKIDYSLQTDISGNLGPIDFTLEGNANTGSAVIVTLADGTSTKTSEVTHGENIPLTITQSYDAQGQEIVSKHAYSYEVEVTKSKYPLINTVHAGDVNQSMAGPLQPGQTVTLTFTEAQMADMQQTTHDILEDDPHASSTSVVTEQTPDDSSFSTLDFALAIAKDASHNDAGFGEMLFRVSGHADGDTQTTISRKSDSRSPSTTEPRDAHGCRHGPG